MGFDRRYPPGARLRISTISQSGAMPNEPNRLETRTPLHVAVDLASLEIRYPAQQGVTENISLHGARVITGKPWPLGERLNLRSLVGNLRSRARVVYCEMRPTGDFVLGLQLSATAGEWIQFVELSTRADYLNIDRYVFAPPAS